MSLVLKFQTPQNPDASQLDAEQAGVFQRSPGPRVQLTTAGVQHAAQWESHEQRRPISYPTQSAPLGFVISDRESNTSELPINDLLTSPGNSD
jgi:hypothetical protein